MKQVALKGSRQFEMTQAAVPSIIHPTDVLVRIRMVGVCGSDIHYYTSGRIGSQTVQFPFVIGHEAAGLIEAVGERVTRVRLGQKIAIDPALSCGHCDQCRAGRENTCRSLLFLGSPGQLPGCLSEYVVLHEQHCFPVPESMTFEQATLSEPLAVAVYAVERAGLAAEANVAILGAGPIGLSVLHVLRTREIGNVYVTDKIPERLGSAEKLQPRWMGNPDRLDVVEEIARIEPLLLDAVFECSGNPEAILQAIHLLKPGGILLIVGITEVDEVTLPIHELRRKEITIFNIRRQANCTEKAIDLLAHGHVQMDWMATHHFPLAETGTAFDLVSGYHDGVIKAIITL
jgi:L-iditol 2-dehydrogenase